MKRNVPKRERSIRVIGGIILLLIAANVFTGGIKTLIFLIGLILLITGAIGYCPLYSFLKSKGQKED